MKRVKCEESKNIILIRFIFEIFFKDLYKILTLERLLLQTFYFTYIHNWKSSNIYVTPKVHKNKQIIKMCKKSNSEYVHMSVPSDLKGRPIIAGPEAPTQLLSELLEKLLSSLVVFLKSFVKDDWDFIGYLPHSVDFDCELYSVDVISLYTNIPHALGVEAISHYIDKYRDKFPHRFTKEFIVESILFVLEKNNFFFDEVCHHQKVGTAMGTKFAPPYASQSIGYLEETELTRQLLYHFETSVCKLIIRWFLRYIDDGFVLWPKGHNIDTFFEILNYLNIHIQFTIEPSNKYIENDVHVQELAFLDILDIVRDNRAFATDIFYNETTPPSL